MPNPFARHPSRAAVVLLVILLGGATGCASLEGVKPQRCHGARRPANAHGSVLAPDIAPVAAAGAPARACGATAA